MFTWYNKKAPKNTITRYLSTKYSLEQLATLTQLELPDKFESLNFSEELQQILANSPWKNSEVKYLPNIFTKDYWFGKKDKKVELKDYEIPNPFSLLTDENQSETSSLNSDDQSQEKSIYFDSKEEPQASTSFASQAIKTYLYHFLTDNESKITHWKTTFHSHWQTDPYHYYYLEKEQVYPNSQLLIETSQKLPFSFAFFADEPSHLFELTDRESMLAKKDWVYSYLVESNLLNKCENCLGNLLPEENVCEKCVYEEQIKELNQEQNEPKPNLTPNPHFWEDGNNLLIIAGVITVAVIIYNTN